MRELFRQFSFPGGVPSHVAPETPGSIHESGELDYSLSHAYGAAFDNPGLPVDQHLAADGRVTEILSGHACQGWIEGYLLTSHVWRQDHNGSHTRDLASAIT